MKASISKKTVVYFKNGAPGFVISFDRNVFFERFGQVHQASQSCKGTQEENCGRRKFPPLVPFHLYLDPFIIVDCCSSGRYCLEHDSSKRRPEKEMGSLLLLRSHRIHRPSNNCLPLGILLPNRFKHHSDWRSSNNVSDSIAANHFELKGFRGSQFRFFV